MKKLLVLLVVLGMASIASASTAALIDIVSTGYDDLDQSGSITASDIIYIDIIASGQTDGFDLDLHVTGPGTLVEVGQGPVDISGTGFFWKYSGIENNAIAQVTNANLFGQWEGTIVSGLAIHCEGEGNVLVQLTLNGATRVDGGVITADQLGSLEIVQVPEPMTMSLLGLGGLALIRRRRA